MSVQVNNIKVRFQEGIDHAKAQAAENKEKAQNALDRAGDKIESNAQQIAEGVKNTWVNFESKVNDTAADIEEDIAENNANIKEGVAHAKTQLDQEIEDLKQDLQEFKAEVRSNIY